MLGRECAYEIFAINHVVEKCLCVNKKVYATFIDFEKANGV